MSDDFLRSIIDKNPLGKTYANEKRISVVYPYFEREEYLIKSIESVFSQSSGLFQKNEIEVIVIDDGSKEASVYKKLPAGSIYLWQPKHFFGASRARNVGAKIANGEFLFFVDPDVILSPTYFDSALNIFHKFGSRVLQTGFIWDYFYPGSEDSRLQFGAWETPNIPTRRFSHLASGSMAITKALFDEVGGFDEDLVYGGWEDLLFGYCVGRQLNTAMVFNTGMQCWHLPHPPSPREAAPDLSARIVKLKYPEFYESFVVQGNR